ncbi:MAG: vitamin K epoxide reductase family protein, partial [Oligoflexia bacterium]|nr:vitamin K epoxide reductase family protein [Oligoflexia bacterium]
MEGNLSLVLGCVLTGWLISAGLMWKDRRLGLAAAATMGLVVSFYLGWQHLDGAGSSICSINETFDCDKVNRSAWSELYGVPISFIGTAFYSAVLTASGLGLSKPDGYKRAGSFILAGGLISVAYSAFLAWASVQLGAWCLFCISLYGINLLILAGGWWSRHPDGFVAAVRDKSDRTLSTMLTSGLLVFVVVMAWYNMQKGGAVAEVAKATAGGNSTDAYAQLMEQPGGVVTLDGTEPVLGNP